MRAIGVPAKALRGVQSRPRVSDVQPSFSGGLNTIAADEELLPNQVRTCDNGILDEFGDVKKRLGMRRLHADAIAAAPIRNGICWRTASTHEYLAACNGALYSGGTYSANMTWTSQGALTNSTVYPSFAAFRDASGEAVYIGDGSLRKYNGSLSAPAGAASVKQLAVYNTRLFGITGDTQTLYWSAQNDGDSLGNAGSGGGSAVIRTFGNQKITALHTLKYSLAIFHVSGISVFTGYTQDDISISSGVQGFSVDCGTIAPRSIISVDSVCYFLSDRGIFALTDAGVIPLETIQNPDPMRPVLTNLGTTDFEQIDAAFDRATDTVRWTIPSSGIYVFHPRLRAWSGPWSGGYTTTVMHCLFDGIDNDGKPITVVGGADGFLRHCDYAATYLDDVLYDGTGGSAYTLSVQLRRMYTQDAEAEKAWRWGYVFCDLRGSITANIEWQTSTGAGSYTLPNPSQNNFWGAATWGSFTWGGTGGVPYRVPLSGRGTFIDITISDDGEAASTYSRVTVDGFNYGRRG